MHYLALALTKQVSLFFLISHHFISILLYAPQISFLSLQMYNPSIYETWCNINKYPTHSCDNCQKRGGDNYNKQLLSTLLVSIIILGATIIIVCMTIIIFGSWKNNPYFFPQKSSSQQQATDDLASSEPSGRQSQFPPRGGRSSFDRRLRERKEKGENDWKAMRKTLVIQSLMYIFAFIFTWFFTLLRMFLNSTGKSRTRVVDILYLVFFPLQGFLNALVFVSHKVHNIKRLDKSISNCRALVIIFLHPKDMPEAIISGIAILEQQTKENDKKNAGGARSNELESSRELDAVSKEGNVSIAAEVSFMFDLSRDSSNQKQEGLSMNSSQSLSNLFAKDGSPRGDNESQQDLSSSSNLFIDNDISLHDASTVIASHRSQLF